jgi:hypothetical protein
MSRIIRIWHEVETRWKDALLIALATKRWDLDTYQAILTIIEQWMVEQWEISRPGNGDIFRITAHSRQDRASRRLLYEIAVTSNGGMKWWTVLEVPRNGPEIRAAFHGLLKRYRLGSVAQQKMAAATLVAKRASKIMARAYEDAKRSFKERRGEYDEGAAHPTTRFISKLEPIERAILRRAKGAFGNANPTDSGARYCNLFTDARR